jgi:hypothetical protein
MLCPPLGSLRLNWEVVLNNKMDMAWSNSDHPLYEILSIMQPLSEILSKNLLEDLYRGQAVKYLQWICLPLFCLTTVWIRVYECVHVLHCEGHLTLDRRIGQWGVRLGLTRFQLVQRGLTWFHSASLGFTWFHLVFGFIWSHLVSLGFTWFHLVSLGLRWSDLGSISFTCFNLVSCGFTRFRLDSLALAWTHVV